MSVPSRLLFRERQLLRAADLQTEQQYLLGLAGRHQVAPHAWGIVRGLSILLQGDVATVRPGLAIDGYGRELVVFQPVRLTFSQQTSPQYVYLYYCERPKGACGSVPNPRFQDSAEAQVSATASPIPSDNPNLTSATAAGGIIGAVPWPVLLGIIKARRDASLHVHYSHCVYTRLRASLICSPAGGTVVRVGPENLADPYNLGISLRNAASNFQKRFAIDRDGDAIFWGNLILTSAQRGALLPTLIDGVFLKVQVKPNAAGVVRVQTSFTPSTMTLHFRVSGTAQGTADDILKLDISFSATQRKQAIRNFNKSSSSVVLKEADLKSQKKSAGLRRLFAGVPPPKPATPVLDDRLLTVDFTGADLSFVPEDVPTLLPCDCLTPVDHPELLPEGFIFLPGANPPAPPARDLYSLHQEPKDQLPSDELRISGGAKKDGDFSRRIVVSGQNKNGFIPLLAFRGNGSLALPGDLSTAAVASHLLFVVGGTAQLPIVKPDPRDPLFNYLLVLAFIQGIMTASSQLVKVDFPSFPTFFETNQNLDYMFSLQNLSTTEPLKPDKCSETIVTNTLSVFGTVPFTTTLQPSAGPTAVQVSHPPGQLPAGATSLQVEIDVSMKLGNLSVAGKKRSPTVPILPSPAADLSGLTDPIPHGTQFPVAITNTSPVDLVLTVAQLTAPGAVQNLLGIGSPPLTVPAGQSIALPVQAGAPAAAAANVQFTVQITYHWMFAGSPSSNSSLTFSKTVTVS